MHQHTIYMTLKYKCKVLTPVLGLIVRWRRMEKRRYTRPLRKSYTYTARADCPVSICGQSVHRYLVERIQMDLHLVKKNKWHEDTVLDWIHLPMTLRAHSRRLTRSMTIANWRSNIPTTRQSWVKDAYPKIKERNDTQRSSIAFTIAFAVSLHVSHHHGPLGKARDACQRPPLNNAYSKAQHDQWHIAWAADAVRAVTVDLSVHIMRRFNQLFHVFLFEVLFMRSTCPSSSSFFPI